MPNYPLPPEPIDLGPLAPTPAACSLPYPLIVDGEEVSGMGYSYGYGPDAECVPVDPCIVDGQAWLTYETPKVDFGNPDGWTQWRLVPCSLPESSLFDTGNTVSASAPVPAERGAQFDTTTSSSTEVATREALPETGADPFALSGIATGLVLLGAALVRWTR